MLYRLLFAITQSIPAITSETYAIPALSITSTSTSGALGARTGVAEPEPAAMPATMVPWPRPSPGDSLLELESLTDATILFPKSSRFSMPESMIAIPGACGAGDQNEPQSEFSRIAEGHGWFELSPSTRAGHPA